VARWRASSSARGTPACWSNQSSSLDLAVSKSAKFRFRTRDAKSVIYHDNHRGQCQCGIPVQRVDSTHHELTRERLPRSMRVQRDELSVMTTTSAGQIVRDAMSAVRSYQRCSSRMPQFAISRALPSL
jgi:hypothetical protein